MWTDSYCSDICVNIPGSYQCPEGRLLNDDQLTCSDIPCSYTDWGEWEDCKVCSGMYYGVYR